jgi:hypothetical protein
MNLQCNEKYSTLILIKSFFFFLSVFTKGQEEKNNLRLTLLESFVYRHDKKNPQKIVTNYQVHKNNKFKNRSIIDCFERMQNLPALSSYVVEDKKIAKKTDNDLIIIKNRFSYYG